MMENQPEISVIIPVYNVEKRLSRCIDSLLNQSYKNFEILLIDDGSLDRSGSICDEYAARVTNIRTYHQMNQGVSAARNKGLDLAVGEYIVFIDGDDHVAEDYLKHLLQMPGDLVISGNQTFPIKNRRQFTDKKYKGGEIKVLLNQYCPPVVWGNLYRRTLIYKSSVAFMQGVRVGEDLLFNLDYIKQCSSIQTISNVDYFYYCPTNIPRDIRCNYSSDEIRTLCFQIGKKLDELERIYNTNLKERIMNYYIYLYPLTEVYDKLSDSDYYKLFCQYNGGVDKDTFYRNSICSPIIRTIRLVVNLYEQDKKEEAKSWSNKLLALYATQIKSVGIANVPKRFLLSYLFFYYKRIWLHDIVCRSLRRFHLIKLLLGYKQKNEKCI